MNPEYEYEFTEDHYWIRSVKTPKYNILETITDPVTGTTWHKLKTNAQATELIIKNKAHSQWEIRDENTGKKFFWVTDQLLTILHVQGLQKGY